MFCYKIKVILIVLILVLGINSESQSSYEVLIYSNATDGHTESPVWDPELQTLYWVDVHNHDVHMLDYSTGRHSFICINGKEVNIVLPVLNSNLLLVSVKLGLYLLERTSYDGVHNMQLLAEIGEGPKAVLNEGKADAKGRFWGGTKGPQSGDTVAPSQAALYSVSSPDFSPRRRLSRVTISNGLTWSLNNTLMYYIDSGTRAVDVFDFDLENGEISNRRTILNISSYFPKEVIPDGMTIDREGFLWVALMFGGAVIRIDPYNCRIVAKYDFPVSHITSVVWAGPAMEDLVVTTSRHNLAAIQLSRQPLAGAIFVLRDLGTGGIPSYKFKIE